jgi:cobalt-zinc-cadmium efflux system membrane fusion protein
MKPLPWRRTAALAAVLLLIPFVVSCARESKGAPTKADVNLDPNLFQADHPELFKVVKVETRDLPTVLEANATVSPDLTRTIHVTSQGSGRVTDLRVRLGDYVKKGQVLLTIFSSDLGGAFADYQKAIADEKLARKSLDRADLLYSHGALAEKDLQQFQDAEEKAKVDVQTTEAKVRLLGGDPANPSPLIELRAPVSGAIVEQNVAGFEGIKTLDNSPNLFTIADLSEVWVLADVFENDLGAVRLGDSAEIRLNAYPDKSFAGKVGDISRVLDPSSRAAKVRIELHNRDGLLRPGMFAMARFTSRTAESRLVVPATATMRLQDKDWIFRQEGNNQFRKLQVQTVGTTTDGYQEVTGAVKTGDRVIVNALEFSTAMAGQNQ